MQTTRKTQRSSSCRGVAFEIKPHIDLFAIDIHDNNNEPSPARRFSFQFGSSLKTVSSSNTIERSTSRTSIRFCDLEPEENGKDYDNYLEDLEQGHEADDSKKTLLKVSVESAKSKKEQPSKPNAKDSRLSVILLDQGFFTVYKRLFLLCLALNIIVLVFSATGHFSYGRQKATLFSIGNIFALVLCRSEAFLRIIFYLSVKIFGPRWVPLPIKTAITSLLQSLGGIHSGCGISSIAWLIYSLVLTLKNRENTSIEIIILASTILSFISLSSLAAFPLVRHLHHNLFERTHRLAGWTALALLWSFIFLTLSYDPKTKSYANSFGSKLVKSQEFWLTLVITLLIILPWLTVKWVKVEVYAPSNHASIIKFEGGVKAGILGRISPSPLSEWHAFGIISDGKEVHTMLVGAVGDFTRSVVSNPPSHLWVRQIHFVGLPYLANMYERVLFVATGSGICVFLSFLLQPSRADVCLLWVAKGIEQNFGKEIKDLVSGFPKDKVIVYDTTVLGRPNVSQMSVDAAKNWGAEVVIVTSNPEGSRDVVNVCKSAGIPAFGPIWDS